MEMQNWQKLAKNWQCVKWATGQIVDIGGTSGMGMVKVKADIVSSRVKGIAFHPQLPFLLTSLHTSEIQLWDYEKSVLLETLEGHTGPVRGIDFHCRESLFVSGGDDYQVIVWDFKLKRRLFSLTGHSDYVRTVFFHDRHPWIVSASDDQTVRVWNWQSRAAVCVLTGHCHYVMCARFHPLNDLMVSSSLDHTARVWKIPSEYSSGNGPRMGSSYERTHLSQHVRGGSGTVPADGGFEVKFVLEGHEKGVNCAVFHPSQQFIVTCSDDKTVRVWRYSEDSAWQANILRSHVDNVSCIMYYPGDCSLLVSNSEDCTIKVWSCDSWTCLYTFKRKGNRFWTLSSTERRGARYVAAGHDGGHLLLKLMSERPLFRTRVGRAGAPDTDVSGGRVPRVYLLRRDADEPNEIDRLYNSDASFTLYLYGPGEEAPSHALAIKVPGKFSRERMQVDLSPAGPLQLLFLSRNSKRLALVHGLPELNSPKYKLAPEAGRRARASGDAGYGVQFFEAPAPYNEPVSCCFMSKGRVAVGTGRHLLVLNCSFEKVAAFDLSADRVFPAPGGAVFAVVQDALYYVKDSPIFVTTLVGKPLAVVPSPADDSGVPGAKSQGCGEAAFQLIVCRGSVVVLDARLRVVALVHDRGVKSAVWDGPSTVLYTTFTHLKYLMLGGASEEDGSSVGALKCLKEVWYLAYTRADELFYFTRSGELRRMALDMPEYRARQALIGARAPAIVEAFVGQLRNPSLDFINFLREHGHPQHAFRFCKDPALAFSFAKSRGDLAGMVKALEATAQPFATGAGDAWRAVGDAAMKQGCVEVAEMSYQRARHAASLTFLYMLTGQFAKLQCPPQAPVSDPNTAHSLSALLYLSKVPPVVSAQAPGPRLHRPLCLWDGWAKLIPAPAPPPQADAHLPASLPEPALAPAQQFGVADGAWSNFDGVLDEIETPRSQMTPKGAAEKDAAEDCAKKDSAEESARIAAARPAVPELVIAGKFEKALERLQDLQLANPRPLIPHIAQLYQSSVCFAGALPNTLPVAVRINAGDASASLAALNARLLAKGHALVTCGEFVEALKFYRKILYNAMLAYDPEAPTLHLTQEFARARTYVLAMLLEIKRVELAESDIQQSLQMAASLANFDWERDHLFLVLRRTMGIMWKAGNFSSTASIAKRLLDLAPASVPVAQSIDAELDKAKRILQASLKKGVDKFPIALDLGANLCCFTFEKVGEKHVSCPFCSSAALDTFENTLCAVCQLCRMPALHAH